MACTDNTIVAQLRNILNELEGSNGQGQQMVCPRPTQPFAACCMVCPPPILAPTSPEPVKPLQLPCPYPKNDEPEMSPEEAEETRYANFYNNYNIDYRQQSAETSSGNDKYRQMQQNKIEGVTVDGQKPLCNHKRREEQNHTDKGCPTGFKPCTMKLTPPPGCHPCGVWCAEIQPCPPKPKKVSEYNPNRCTRPCCKHWKPKDGECKYDGVCKAHCFEPPPRIKK